MPWGTPKEYFSSQFNALIHTSQVKSQSDKIALTSDASLQSILPKLPIDGLKLGIPLESVVGDHFLSPDSYLTLLQE